MFSTRVGNEKLVPRLDPQYYHPQNIEDDERIFLFRTNCLESMRDTNARITYGVLKPQFHEDGIFRIARIHNFDDPFLDIEGCDFIDEQQFSEYSRSECIPGDILIAVGGYAGRVGIVPKNTFRININRHIARYRHSLNSADRFYILTYLSSSIGNRQLNRMITGSVQAGINLEDLRLFNIPLPSISAQIYIGDKVRQAERLRARASILDLQLTKKVINVFSGNPKPLQKHRSSIGIEFLSENRLEAEFYAPINLWSEHEIRKSRYPHFSLGQLAHRIKDGPGGWGVSTNDYREFGIPVIRSVNILDGECNLEDCVYISEEKHQELISHEVKRGSVILSVRGTIGRSAVFEDEHFQSANLNAAVVTIDCKSEVNPYYLAAFLNSDVGHIQANRIANGAVQLNMNLKEVASNLIVVPPMTLQQNIAEIYQSRIATGLFSRKLIATAKFLVEALIEGQVTESDLVAAQKALETGNQTEDRKLLSRLTPKGMDATGEPPLFPDLDGLYNALDAMDKPEEN